MSQDSCDDEQADPPPTPVDKPSHHRATNTSQDHQETSKPSCWCSLTTWNVVFNGILTATTAFPAFLAYQQLHSAQLEQRAWVGMKEMKMANFEEDDVRVFIKLTNSGKTPSLGADVGVSIFIRADGFPTEMNHANNRVRHAAIFPGTDTFQIAKVEGRRSKEELDSIMGGKKRLYVVSELEYTDVFHESHFTKFCGMYKPELSVFYACDEHQGVS